MSANGSDRGEISVRPGWEVWEKLPRESYKAFEAFALYRDLGVARTLGKVAEALRKSETLIGGWSSKNRWVERAGEYDAHMDRLRRDAAEDEVLAMRRREAALSGATAGLALKRLLGDKDDPSVAQLHPNQLDPGDVARFIEVSVKTGRLATGQPTDVVKAGLSVTTAEAAKVVNFIVGAALQRMSAADQEGFLREISAYGGGE